MSITFPQKRTFEKWLRSLPENTCIAERWSSTNCPLCAFLIDRGYTSEPFVSPDIGGNTEAVWRDDEKSTGPLPLPKWANEFSHGIDRLARLQPFDGGPTFYRAVSPADCLAVLHSAGQELAAHE